VTLVSASSSIHTKAEWDRRQRMTPEVRGCNRLLQPGSFFGPLGHHCAADRLSIQTAKHQLVEFVAADANPHDRLYLAAAQPGVAQAGDDGCGRFGTDEFREHQEFSLAIRRG